MIDRNLLRSRIAFVREGSEVERWHTKRMLQTDTVGHHSFHVAWLAFFMAMGATQAVNIYGIVMAALSHDLAEKECGDMPGDFKREAGLVEQFEEFENSRFARVGLMFGDNLTQAERRIVHMADTMEACFFAVSEASLGNRRTALVFHKTRGWLAEQAPFSETEEAILEFLDELWAKYGVEGPPINEEEGLIPVLQREEADGRSTHIHTPQVRNMILGKDTCACGAVRTAGGGWQQPTGVDSPQSKPPIQGDMPVAEQPLNDATDEQAQPGLVPEQPHSPANARQHGGDHYKGVGYEHWDLVLDTGMNYFQGCATKYVTRWRKHEARETNLLKAIHYIEKLEEAVAAERIKATGTHNVSDIVRFGIANSLNDLEVQVIKDIIGWRLPLARKGLERLRAGYTEPEEGGTGRAFYNQQD